MKHCRLGNHEADVSEFGPNPRAADGLVGSCRACIKIRYHGKYKRDAERNKGKILRTKFQVASFHAFYKAARIGGKDTYNAFISGICYSCDEAVERLPAGSIERWVAFRVSEKARRKALSVNERRKEDRADLNKMRECDIRDKKRMAKL